EIRLRPSTPGYRLSFPKTRSKNPEASKPTETSGVEQRSPNDLESRGVDKKSKVIKELGMIRQSVQIMECNKILAAYTWTIRFHELNDMKFRQIKKLHADAFEAYLGAYYLNYGESATCRYLKDLMIPLFDLVIEK
ncbi:14802_t:CDS:2, partial [Racocetra fulgida]